MSGDVTKFQTWAIVELFGHQRIAGWCTEESVAGQAMLRVDVPAIGEAQAFTRYYGSGAIYGITPCTEEVAKRVASYIRVDPLPVYIPQIPAVRAALGPGESESDFDIEDEGRR